jgi:hypothetical protein
VRTATSLCHSQQAHYRILGAESEVIVLHRKFGNNPPLGKFHIGILCINWHHATIPAWTTLFGNKPNAKCISNAHRTFYMVDMGYNPPNNIHRSVVLPDATLT